MKYALFMAVSNIVSATAVITAAYLALHDKGGWGWFLLVALLCYTTIKGKTKS